MVRSMLMLVSALAFVGAAAPAMAGDCKGCDKVARDGEGFCCGKGIAYGVKLTSKKLHTALVGSKYDGNEIKCPGCKHAIETNGKCEHCKLAVANGRFFHSPVAHTLAKGKLVSAKEASSCKGSKEGHAENGFCEGCGVGFVAGRMFKGEEDYKAALAAHKILAKAALASAKCEDCAVAMVTDGTCESCKVKFKHGKKTT